jgi:hypothetical protein
MATHPTSTRWHAGRRKRVARHVRIGAVTPLPFPPLDSLKVRLPIASKDWTIWPGPPETREGFVIGFPLELHPFAWDYVRISCDGRSVELEPHYRESSFDTFWVDGRGHVTCHALGGLFPFTLGRQPELLDGLRVTVQALPDLVSDPGAAKTLRELADRLAAIILALRKMPAEVLRLELEEHWRRERATPRGRLAHRFWQAKRARAEQARSS